MKPIGELITQPPVASAPPTESNAERFRPEHIPLFWERMAMIYGHKWTSNYGPMDDGTWAKGLSDMTTAQIAQGLEKCRISDDEWPPTLPIFRMRCLPQKVAASFHRPAQKLPRPESKAETREFYLKELRKILSGDF